MRIEGIRTLAGPNVYSHRPVLVMRLDLEELTDKQSLEIEGFNERLLAALPGLHEHRCSKGRPGGFVKRLGTGTYFAHITEHVALELSEGAGVPSYFGKARYAGAPGLYNVIVEYKAEHGMRPLLETAVELVRALVRGEPFPLEERLKEAARLLCEAVNNESPATECQIVLDEVEALRAEIEGIAEGQVIVVFYDRLEPVLEVLGEAGARPVTAITETKTTRP